MLIGQPERLPNIVGFTDWWSYGNGTSSANMGAFFNAAPLLDTGASYNPSSGNKSQLLSFDASRTTGTGSGVYQNGAHVQPNTVTTKMWLRKA